MDSWNVAQNLLHQALRAFHNARQLAHLARGSGAGDARERQLQSEHCEDEIVDEVRLQVGRYIPKQTNCKHSSNAQTNYRFQSRSGWLLKVK